MKPELALLQTRRLEHTRAFQDAVSPYMFGPRSFPSPSPAPQIPNVGQFNTPGSLPTNPGPADAPITTGYLDYGPAGDIADLPGTNIPWLDPSDTDLASVDYPTPGTGAPPPARPSVMSRIVNNIPAVRLTRLLGRAFTPNTPWQQSAASRTGPVQGPPAVPPGGALFAFNPAQGGGTPHFDFTTGRYTTTPAANPLYTTGGPLRTVASAPVDIRFAEQSGTGNFVADQTTKNYLAAGGSRGNPNRAVAPESGRDRFSPQSGVSGTIDPETGLLTRHQSAPVAPFNISQKAGAPPLRAGDPASVAEYNAWLHAQPEYQAWIAQNGNVPGLGQGMDDFGPAGAAQPLIRISGPPGI